MDCGPHRRPTRPDSLSVAAVHLLLDDGRLNGRPAMRDLINRLLGKLDQDRPRFGFGRGRRPLWDERCRDAERIRRALRKAGIKEFGERHGGFVVENGQEGGPFSVAAALDHDETDVEAVMADYTRALTAQGWRVGPDSGPDFQEQILEVWITPG